MIQNMIGQTFGKLTVIRESKKRTESGNKHFRTMCECGNLRIVDGGHLKSGHTQSCGCLMKHKTSMANAKHRMCETRIYHTWGNLHTRCRNPKATRYKNYGGRGISVCREWHDFIAFKNWAYVNGYQENLTIDRINNDGNYEPRNCQWLTSAENTRKARAEKSIGGF